MTQAAIFLDKDGTLVRDIPYNVDPKRIELMHGAGEALQMLQSCGYALIVVTNQPGIGLRRFSEDAMQAVHEHLQALLAPFGVRLKGYYYCPHVPDNPECSCRKPRPGLLQRAAAAHGIELAASWMVGDILNDVEAGRRAGCRTVLVDCGNETEWLMNRWRTPDFAAADIKSAAQRIVDTARRSASARPPAPQVWS